MTPVAVMVGANRIVPAAGIIHPLGNAELSPEEEKTLRRRIVEQALQALQTDVAQPTVFAVPSLADEGARQKAAEGEGPYGPAPTQSRQGRRAPCADAVAEEHRP